jgi:hypothetical protein
MLTEVSVNLILVTIFEILIYRTMIITEVTLHLQMRIREVCWTK